MIKSMFAAALLASTFVAGSAVAAPIVVGQWYTFGFGAVGSSLGSGEDFVLGTNPTSIAAPDGPWTFTLGTAGTLTVVDGFQSGDQFTLRDNTTTLLGTTSLPTLGASCSNNISACLGNASFSRGVFNLAAGSHSVTGTVTLSPFGSGAGFFRVAAVPEPATWAMMIGGFGLVGGVMRRRKVSTTVRFA